METVHGGGTATSIDTARLSSPMLFCWSSLNKGVEVKSL